MSHRKVDVVSSKHVGGLGGERPAGIGMVRNLTRNPNPNAYVLSRTAAHGTSQCLCYLDFTAFISLAEYYLFLLGLFRPPSVWSL